MNTKIAKALLTAQDDKLNDLAEEIAEAHNMASNYGLTELPKLTMPTALRMENETVVNAFLLVDSVNINELYLLKQAWGADELNVLSEGIELVFKK